MSDTHVPMIPCNVAGPLGVMHLPRLWLKVSLESVGKLAPGYPGIGKGFDQITLDNLGLKADAVRAFIKEKKPTYPEFESWVKSQPGVKLDRASVYKHNSVIQGYHHDAAKSQSILKSVGYPSDGSVTFAAIELNALDDWSEFHAAVLK